MLVTPLTNRFFVILLHQDPREYFDSQQANAFKALGDTDAGIKPIDCSLNTEEAYVYLMEQISEVKVRGLDNPVIQPQAALKVNLSALTVNYIFCILNFFV